MATIIGAFLQIYNKDTGQWDTHYFTTHANAIIQTTEKQFISEELKNFIKNIKGDISGNYIDYDELTDTVLSNTNEISGVKSRVSSIEALINLDEDNIISNLQEILDFISAAEITEGKTITEFVDDITKLKVNDTNPIGATNEISIYAPTNKGTVDQILVSTGTSTPQFKTIKNVVVKETTPSASDYGKTSFQGGEIWIYTGSTTPSEPILTYNTILKFNAPSDILNQFIAFIENPNNQDINYYHPATGIYSYSVPIITFSTNEGIRRLEFYILQNENYGHGQYYGFQYAGNILLECCRTSNYVPGMPEDHTWSPLEIVDLNEQEIIIPGGQVLSDNR